MDDEFRIALVISTLCQPCQVLYQYSSLQLSLLKVDNSHRCYYQVSLLPAIREHFVLELEERTREHDKFSWVKFCSYRLVVFEATMICFARYTSSE